MVFGVTIWPLHNTCRSKARLVGKTVVVTGGNTGIGKEVVRDLYRRGARAILMCRDLNKGQEAIEDIKKNEPSRPLQEAYNGEPGEIALYHLNLASFASIKECAKKVLQSEPALHILINNAGVMACPFGKTEDGFETHIQVNHLGHFLLTLLLLPKLQSSTPGCRIVNIASAIHVFGNIDFDDINLEKSYRPLKAYAQSKLANLLFTKELTRRLKEEKIQGINVYSVHPGVVKSELGRHLNENVFPCANFFGAFHYLGLVKSSRQGAQTTIHCAVDEIAGQETGFYYSECKITRPSSKATDQDKATKFWDLTCNLLGLNPKSNLKDLSKEAADKNFERAGS